jgi:hypothetical protein
MTATEAKWAERVREWQASGRTAEQYAEGQGFKPSTLRFWASRLRSMAKAIAMPAMARGEPAGVQMVRVRRQSASAARPIEASASAATATSSSAAMVIAIGAARIEVQPGFDHRLLGEIVEALGATR